MSNFCRLFPADVSIQGRCTFCLLSMAEDRLQVHCKAASQEQVKLQDVCGGSLPHVRVQLHSPKTVSHRPQNHSREKWSLATGESGSDALRIACGLGTGVDFAKGMLSSKKMWSNYF